MDKNLTYIDDNLKSVKSVTNEIRHLAIKYNFDIYDTIHITDLVYDLYDRMIDKNE